MDIFAFVLISYCSLVFLSGFSDAVDSITQFQFLIEGMTLVSKNESFVLGFFSPDSSGSLVLLNLNSTIAWSTNSTKHVSNPILQLLDSGNLVHLSAWKSPDDPSPGELTYGIEHHKYNELVMKKGSEMFFRTDPWDGYGHNGVPDICESPLCQCLEGFKPKSPDTWNQLDWSMGCVRTTQLSCQDKIEFAKFVGLKLPDTTNSWVDGSMNLEECRVKCLNNCSCMAYSNLDIRDEGSGCVIWYGDLIDIRQNNANGQELYIRMSSSEIEPKKGGKTKIAVVVPTAALAVGFGMLLIGFYICRSSTNLKDLSTIASATNNFAINNKLGEGGFGPVYKGILEDGQEIAVKRLSRSSKQGLNEFKNESWILWNEDKPLELIDECLGKSCPLSEVLRCIHLSLLCVQQRPEDRPSMSSVVVVLGRMKLGWDSRTGLEWRLSAWKSPDDPSLGELNYGLEQNNYPQVIMKKGTEKYFRTGPWNGYGHSGVYEKANQVYNYSFVSSKDELFIWVEVDKKWIEFSSVPKDKCDTYNLCGVYGNCIIGEIPICQCLEGFKPKSPNTWNLDEWSKGCVRTTQLSCQHKDKIGFNKFVGLKLPDATYTWVNGSMNLEECKVKCLNDCMVEALHKEELCKVYPQVT
uniref:non-specific serine/threonine protein kinase n=1 Tax=Fagus sylvatica TaxID=28930 RepID=A0A2N9HTB4_FAGSY